MYINLNTGKQSATLPKVVVTTAGVVQRPSLKEAAESGWREMKEVPAASDGYTIIAVKWVQDAVDPLKAKAQVTEKLTSEIAAEQAAAQAAAIEAGKARDADPSKWSRQARAELNWLVKQINLALKAAGAREIREEDIKAGLRAEVDADASDVEPVP